MKNTKQITFYTCIQDIILKLKKQQYIPTIKNKQINAKNVQK